jgi:hypothetical protein
MSIADPFNYAFERAVRGSHARGARRATKALKRI